MLLAKVIGTMNATLKHPAFEGRKIMLVQPLGDDMSAKGAPFLAVDTVQAGVGDTVLAVKEGGSAQMAFGSKTAPVHAAILGIIDQVDIPPATEQASAPAAVAQPAPEAAPAAVETVAAPVVPEPVVELKEDVMERRTFVRVRAPLPCTVEIRQPDGSFSAPQLAEFTDISGGGCSVLTMGDLALGAHVRLSLNLGEEGEALVEGKVVRETHVLVGELPLEALGVEFEDLDEKTRDRIVWFAIDESDHLPDLM